MDVFINCSASLLTEVETGVCRMNCSNQVICHRSLLSLLAVVASKTARQPDNLIDAGDKNSAPHICGVNALSTDSSPSPTYDFYKIKFCLRLICQLLAMYTISQITICMVYIFDPIFLTFICLYT